MTIRPIIFSAPMVRALLDGRKTQTRRVLKPPKFGSGMYMNPTVGALVNSMTGSRIRIPYATGDLLWCREAFQMGWPLGDDDTPDQHDEHGNENPLTVWYRATDDINRWVDGDGNHRGVPWRPSILMPRWASRITLRVTDVRVQRLQDISEDDAVAEGATSRPGAYQSPDWSMDWSQIGRWSRVMGRPLDQAAIALGAARWAFASYWNDLHGPDAWDANPWVAAISFDVIRKNVGEVEG